jgi:aminoglycoside phosphotransferase (APT) family kinase protein
VEQVANWLAEHLPPERGASMIHNDYKFDNVILDANDLTNILAVLDWEMATIGDPLMDLGTSLAYWIEAKDSDELQTTRFGLTSLPGNLTRAELVQRYSQRSGRDVSDVVFYYAYGLFKLAVVSQQLYLRYKLGYTKEPRFERTINSVGSLCRVALDVIQKNRV